MDHNVEFLSNEIIQEKLSYDELLLSNSTFPHRMVGEAMAPFLMEGDELLVDSSLTAKSGHLIVCHLDGETLARWLSIRSNRHYLIAENKRFSDILINEEQNFKVFGVVKAVVRHLSRRSV